MDRWKRVAMILAVVPAVALLMPTAAAAYGGPGTIVSGIGAFLAVLVAIVASIFGFFWYPLKKLLRKGRSSGAASSEQPASTSEQIPS
jgi:uncharacterized RDD family membrane protein YckC